MPKYRVLETSFIGHALRQPGEIVDYDGEASSNLFGPVDDEGNLIEGKKPKKAKAAPKSRATAASKPDAKPAKAKKPGKTSLAGTKKKAKTRV